MVTSHSMSITSGRGPSPASKEEAEPRPILESQEHPAAGAQRQARRTGRGGDDGHAPSSGGGAGAGRHTPLAEARRPLPSLPPSSPSQVCHLVKAPGSRVAGSS